MAWYKKTLKLTALLLWKSTERAPRFLGWSLHAGVHFAIIFPISNHSISPHHMEFFPVAKLCWWVVCNNFSKFFFAYVSLGASVLRHLYNQRHPNVIFHGSEGKLLGSVPALSAQLITRTGQAGFLPGLLDTMYHFSMVSCSPLCPPPAFFMALSLQ